MTREEIISMAREAGFTVGYGSPALEKHERFAKLVAEKEREACAKICDEFFKGQKTMNYSDTIAICIRARKFDPAIKTIEILKARDNQ